MKKGHAGGLVDSGGQKWAHRCLGLPNPKAKKDAARLVLLPRCLLKCCAPPCSHRAPAQDAESWRRLAPGWAPGCVHAWAQSPQELTATFADSSSGSQALNNQVGWLLGPPFSTYSLSLVT